MKTLSTTTPITIRGIRTFGNSPIKGYLALTTKTAKKFAADRKAFILFKKMTEPEDVPIMRQAAAVCTLEGGPACHAAIVCSTMGIPCVTNLSTLKLTLKKPVPHLHYNSHLIKEGTFISITGDCVTMEIEHV